MTHSTSFSKTSFKRLRLILGDQLNASHSWFQEKDPQTLYVIAELKQESEYVQHHTQKICAFFAAMERFTAALNKSGHRARHMTLDETSQYADLPDLLAVLIRIHQIAHFEYQQPDEYRLSEQLRSFCQDLDINSRCVSTEHFFLAHEELEQYFSPSKHVRMENFYRKMRKRFNVLIQDNDPEGGAWNYDGANRNSFKQTDIADIPEPLVFANDVSHILARLDRHRIKSYGHAPESLLWPVTRQQARSLLTFFCETCLPLFGKFQDAMTDQSAHAWSLYHSRLSFALNSKMLSPHEVIDQAIAAYYDQKDRIDIAQIEGFVRQILGWREYVRGMYWVNMPNYRTQNVFSSDRQLPKWYWTGETKMHCMSTAIKQSLQYSYAHHIQRLMVTGNFALLAGIHPDQVDDWYLGIYIDAIEWVELPNTRGMALFADGGWIATKPYAASGNYINKMSDYCKQCHYKVKLKHEDNACPMNSLYWHFISRNLDKFSNNLRLAFPVRQWQKMSESQRDLIRKRGETVLNDLNEL